MKNEDLKHQIENIAEETKQGIDEITSRIFDEFDWLSNEHAKITEALKTIQNKLREKRDEYQTVLDAQTQDWDKRTELEGKIELLESKLKQVAILLKKELLQK